MRLAVQIDREVRSLCEILIAKGPIKIAHSHQILDDNEDDDNEHGG